MKVSIAGTQNSHVLHILQCRQWHGMTIDRGVFHSALLPDPQRKSVGETVRKFQEKTAHSQTDWFIPPFIIISDIYGPIASESVVFYVENSKKKIGWLFSFIPTI